MTYFTSYKLSFKSCGKISNITPDKHIPGYFVKGCLDVMKISLRLFYTSLPFYSTTKERGI